MKFISVIIFVLFISCSPSFYQKTLTEYKLKNGNLIKLIYYKDVPFGATASYPIMVKYIKNGQTFIVDQLDMDYRDKVDITELNDTLINCRFNSTFFEERYKDFIVNLNKRIETKDNW